MFIYLLASSWAYIELLDRWKIYVQDGLRNSFEIPSQHLQFNNQPLLPQLYSNQFFSHQWIEVITIFVLIQIFIAPVDPWDIYIHQCQVDSRGSSCHNCDRTVKKKYQLEDNLGPIRLSSSYDEHLVLKILIENEIEQKQKSFHNGREINVFCNRLKIRTVISKHLFHHWKLVEDWLGNSFKSWLAHLFII